MHIFDIWVFNPFAQSCRNILLGQCYRHNELEKWRSYDERVREVEHGTFPPLVFFTAGGRGNTATVVYKRIASLVAGKQSKLYSDAALAQMQTEFFAASFSGHVPPRVKIISPQSCLPPSATMEVACAEVRVPAYI